MEEAIYQDCKYFIDSFINAGDYSFAGFSMQWRLQNMKQLIKENIPEVDTIQSINCIYNFACKCMGGKAVWSSNESMIEKQRIGAIFLLYATYVTQGKNIVKIKLTAQLYKAMMTFFMSLPQNQVRQELQYVAGKLIQCGAFRFCLLDFQAGLDIFPAINLNNVCEVYTAGDLEDFEMEYNEYAQYMELVFILVGILSRLRCSLNSSMGSNYFSTKINDQFIAYMKKFGETLKLAKDAKLDWEKNENRDNIFKKNIYHSEKNNDDLHIEDVSTSNTTSGHNGIHIRRKGNYEGRQSVITMFKEPEADWIKEEYNKNN
ncbi:uncharacterized protein LOC119684586 [Teleopsis dalmanni]|uniref:uncharacterized protein LOC119684586 n=1 Tax=Teleopsis dalmanni TaxID=139649 RepID=UPI0018CF31A0|nr:uncharacterized protein LOC119684586 [Teleopsis dalmanni]